MHIEAIDAAYADLKDPVARRDWENVKRGITRLRRAVRNLETESVCGFCLYIKGPNTVCPLGCDVQVQCVTCKHRLLAGETRNRAQCPDCGERRFQEVQLTLRIPNCS